MSGPRNELDQFRRQLARTRAGLVACALTLASLVATGFGRERPADEVLRVRGLIIEDAEGRARILLGAPVPQVAERVRTDREKVIAAWGPRFGGQMDWYFEGVDNDAYGLLVLDEHGHDRIAIGSPTPDPCIGPRIEPSHGIQLNDEQGLEVGGMGYFVERKQTGLGLDNQQGEGVYLLAARNGTSGMIVNDHDEGSRLFVGLAQEESGLDPGHKHLGASITSQDGRWWGLGVDSGFVPLEPEASDGEDD